MFARGARQMQPAPAFFDHRIKIFDRLKAEHDAFVAGEPPVLVFFLASERACRTRETRW